jgi:hypothetical protein
MTSNRRTTRLLTVLIAAGAAIGLLSTGATSAHAAATPGHRHQAGHASPVVIPAPQIRPAASFRVVNFHSGRCLGITGGRKNAPAVQWSCNTHPDQQWHWGSQNSAHHGWFQLINGDGECLGVAAGSKKEGAQVVGWTCDGSSHLDQYWAPVGATCSGYVPLEDLNSGFVLGVSANSTAQGAKIVQWRYQGVCNNQFWFGL